MQAVPSLTRLVRCEMAERRVIGSQRGLEKRLSPTQTESNPERLGAFGQREQIGQGVVGGDQRLPVVEIDAESQRLTGHQLRRSSLSRARWLALLERALGHVNVLAQQARGLVGVARAHRAQDGLVLLDRPLEPAAQTERGGEVAAHLIHQREVDPLEVVILGALDEEGVEGMVGREEGVGVVRRGVLPHLLLQPAQARPGRHGSDWAGRA